MAVNELRGAAAIGELRALQRGCAAVAQQGLGEVNDRRPRLIQRIVLQHGMRSGLRGERGIGRKLERAADVRKNDGAQRVPRLVRAGYDDARGIGSDDARQIGLQPRAAAKRALQSGLIAGGGQGIIGKDGVCAAAHILHAAKELMHERRIAAAGQEERAHGNAAFASVAGEKTAQFEQHVLGALQNDQDIGCGQIGVEWRLEACAIDGHGAESGVIAQRTEHAGRGVCYIDGIEVAGALDRFGAQDGPVRIQQLDGKGARDVQLRHQTRRSPIKLYPQLLPLFQRKPRGGIAIGEVFRSRLLVLGRNEANRRTGSGVPIG